MQTLTVKYLTFVFASLAFVLAVVQATTVKRANPLGIDVSSAQPNVNWSTVARNGIQFVYIKATEGTGYISPTFNSQYTGATQAKLIRGSYHFAYPNISSGGAQATYFLAHGGGWTPDGITLPGALDLEDYPHGTPCYSMSISAMVSWIQDFSNTYKSATGRYPVFYTTTSWWIACTGNSAAFGNNNPLWIAQWSSSLGALPAGWQYHSFWQYADSAGANPGDADLWNGDYAGLQRMARGA